jgi:two-component system, OmpR family, sensor histidine kinase VicK
VAASREGRVGGGSQPWRIAIAAVVGLLLLTVVDSFVGLALNRRVEQITEEALRYDVELEDEADDLRVAVLDVRHYHRNLAFAGASRGAIDDFEGAVGALEEEIGELAAIGVRDADAPQPNQIAALAERYYAEFRPAVDRYDVDRAAFIEASDRGLVLLAELGDLAEALDKLGEERAAAALISVEQATGTARVALVAVLGVLVPIAAVLAYSAVRMVGELRRLYAQEQAAGVALAQAARAKADFLADVSHELRTPLTVLRGNAEVGLELGRECVHAEMLEEIVKESARASRMVEDLLFLARSDSAAPLELETVAVAPFMAELEARAQVLARERGASLRAELTVEGQVRIDPGRIEQAVLILVDNAAKYSPPGEPVTLSSATEHGELCIAVADRGPGIPAAELPRVFERFYRLDKARARKEGGAGLGLAIAKTIVEAHGGRIVAASSPGEGTRMTLFLPLLARPRPGERPLEDSAGRAR